LAARVVVAAGSAAVELVLASTVVVSDADVVVEGETAPVGPPSKGFAMITKAVSAVRARIVTMV
jgi:hypothetical protein